MLENHKFKNEVESKNEIIKDLHKQIDDMKLSFDEERAQWKIKESDYTIKLQSISAKKPEVKTDNMYFYASFIRKGNLRICKKC